MEEVMNCIQPRGEYLSGHVEVPEIRPRIIGARITAALRVQGSGVPLVPAILYNQFPLTCKESSVPRHPCRQNAVEHVYSLLHAKNQILRSSDAHKIPRLIGREMRRGGIHHSEHEVFLLPHREPAYGVSVESDLNRSSRALGPEFGIHPSLHYAEEGLRRIRLSGLAPLCPAKRHLHRVSYVDLFSRVWRTLIQRHHYIRTKRLLYKNGLFGGEKTHLSVQVASELDAF